MHWHLCVLVFCVFLATSAASTTYDQSQTLSDNYKIFWKVDKEELFLQLEVATPGWVGFGIAESASGSMPGADIVTAYYDDTTKQCEVKDRFATAYGPPSIDTCQNWKLVECGQENGKTTVHLSRKLNTTDEQDRVIE